jgi:hypothetical protein
MAFAMDFLCTHYAAKRLIVSPDTKCKRIVKKF